MNSPSPNGAEPILRVAGVTPRWGSECCLVPQTQGVALGYGVDAPLARKMPRTKGANPISPAHSSTKGAEPVSPGHRPGNGRRMNFPSPNGAEPILRVTGVSPRWGSEYGVGRNTQGVALGYGVDAPLARKMPRTKGANPISPAHSNTKGAKPVSPGHRPGNTSPPPISSPERAELEARIVENVAEILEI